MNASYLSPILSLAASLIGLGITYGMLKTVVDVLKAEVERLRTTTSKHSELLSDLREEVRVSAARQEVAAHRR